MEGDAKGAEFRERGSIFKQMAEMKKKIQLVEGERKAIFEDCESEKQENKDKIKALKDEVKVLQVSLRFLLQRSHCTMRQKKALFVWKFKICKVTSAKE